MMQRKGTYTLCVMMVSSSVSMWGMAEVRTNNNRALSQGSGREILIRPAQIHSGSVSPIGASRVVTRRNSAPDSPRGSQDLRRSLAALILNQESPLNEARALPSPSGNSLQASYPDTPRSFDEKTSTSKTPDTPMTPAGYILPSVQEMVIDHQLKQQSLEGGSVIERIRVFPRAMFSSNPGDHVDQDYGTIYLKVNAAAKTCVLLNVELNENLSISYDLKKAIKEDLMLHAVNLAGERQKELREQGIENI